MAYQDVIIAQTPLVYWRMGESAGTTLTDQMGLHNLTTFNSPTLSQTGALVGNADTAIKYLRASNHYAYKASAAANTGNVFSISYWIKRNSIFASNLYGVILDNGAGHNGTQGVPVLYLNDTTAPGVSKTVIASYGFGEWAKSTGTITDTTTFHHCVITKNGATGHFYLDNVDGINIVAAKTFATTNSGIYVGMDGAAGSPTNGTGCDATIDELAIWNRELSAAEVDAQYQAGLGNFGVTATNRLALLGVT